ncbi:MAG: FAD:protein FMN transferase [Clostridia bacterium]|jgi:thiamine biosynthesis lipoprotein|nr:FAD:protein FMN transferase [Clostridia bacterium]
MTVSKRIVSWILVITLGVTSIVGAIFLFNGEGFFKTTVGIFFGVIPYELRVWANDEPEVTTEVVDTINALNNEINVTTETSKLYYLNNLAEPLENVYISLDTYNLISIAKSIFLSTEGILNPAIYPVAELWNLSADRLSLILGQEVISIPTNEQIEIVMQYCDFNDFTLGQDETGYFINKNLAENKIELGAIAKGYACDLAYQIFSAHNVKGAYLEIGGNLITYGDKTDGSKYNIAIQNPRTSEDYSAFGVARIDEQTISVSGDYNRYYYYLGDRVNHIINGQTGYPVNNSVIMCAVQNVSSSVPNLFATENLMVTPYNYSSTYADAFSTVLFILGDQARTFAINNGLSVILAFETELYTYEYFASSGLDFTLINQNYVQVFE